MKDLSLYEFYASFLCVSAEFYSMDSYSVPSLVTYCVDVVLIQLSRCPQYLLVLREEHAVGAHLCHQTAQVGFLIEV